jgi:hypothetical protein
VVAHQGRTLRRFVVGGSSAAAQAQAALESRWYRVEDPLLLCAVCDCDQDITSKGRRLVGTQLEVQRSGRGSARSGNGVGRFEVMLTSAKRIRLRIRTLESAIR